MLVQLFESVDNRNVKITYRVNSFTVIIKSLNIRIEASWHGNHMNYQLFVPRRACIRAYGHLGNCDGNPNNDVSIAGANDCK